MGCLSIDIGYFRGVLYWRITGTALAQRSHYTGAVHLYCTGTVFVWYVLHSGADLWSILRRSGVDPRSVCGGGGLVLPFYKTGQTDRHPHCRRQIGNNQTGIVLSHTATAGRGNLKPYLSNDAKQSLKAQSTRDRAPTHLGTHFGRTSEIASGLPSGAQRGPRETTSGNQTRERRRKRPEWGSDRPMAPPRQSRASEVGSKSRSVGRSAEHRSRWRRIGEGARHRVFWPLRARPMGAAGVSPGWRPE